MNLYYYRFIFWGKIMTMIIILYLEPLLRDVWYSLYLDFKRGSRVGA